MASLPFSMTQAFTVTFGTQIWPGLSRSLGMSTKPWLSSS
jgi:hypothetical protein